MSEVSKFEVLARSNLVVECDQSTNSRWQSGSLIVVNLSQRLISKSWYFQTFFYFALFDKKKYVSMFSWTAQKGYKNSYS